VWITEVIAAEACDQGSLRVVKPERAGSDPWKPLNPGVDAGEASAIALAIQQRDAGHDVLLLIDDRCDRAEARRHELARSRREALFLSLEHPHSESLADAQLGLSD
jgi:predicted nucleic acid-binding protein